MCGIAGFIDFSRSTTAADGAALVHRMERRLAHRGPDDSGVWCDAEHGAFLAHRRLSIVDLSSAGHQPMFSPSQRFVIVFNGEIYNHASLRAELESLAPRRWRGHSDTEVMLAAFDAWGIEKTLPKLVGMFAIAVWDRHERALTLVRDRAGEKPLCWGVLGGRLVFASELKALEGLDASRLTTNRSALPLLLRFGYIPAPHTIYEGIEKLMPGTWLRFGAAGAPTARGVYWSARASAAAGAREPLDLPAPQCVDRLEALLGDAVRLQLEADVPVGAFLSGGIDSSTVVALAQKCASQRVRTFSIGFDEQAFDESAHARRVAEHLGTDHTELHVTSRDALDQVASMAEIYDEPFADSSQIPTYLLAKLTRRSVTVSLSGDGGDELFGGYPRYRRVRSLDRVFRSLPGGPRRAAAAALESLSPRTVGRIAALLGLRGSSHRSVGDSVHRVAQMLRSERHLLYRYLASVMPDVGSIMPGTGEPPTIFDAPSKWPPARSTTETFMWLDFMTYLPDDVLAKVDRATMAVSLESRVPLLDHRIIEFSQRLPTDMKVRNGEQKWILRQLLYRHVPRELVDRPKMGFAVPLNAWLRGPLRGWAEGLLFGPAAHDGWLDEAELRRLWDEQQAGTRNWQHLFWSVLMLRAWMQSRAARATCIRSGAPAPATTGATGT
jgi:asparagine synthase (glutamine-hydrolysing)